MVIAVKNTSDSSSKQMHISLGLVSNLIKDKTPSRKVKLHGMSLRSTGRYMLASMSFSGQTSLCE